jgi:hypothetical protein
MKLAKRRLIQARARHRCEYCRMHEDDDPYTFHVEHIIHVDDRINLRKNLIEIGAFPP